MPTPPKIGSVFAVQLVLLLEERKVTHEEVAAMVNLALEVGRLKASHLFVRQIQTKETLERLQASFAEGAEEIVLDCQACGKRLAPGVTACPTCH